VSSDEDDEPASGSTATLQNDVNNESEGNNASDGSSSSSSESDSEEEDEPWTEKTKN